MENLTEVSEKWTLLRERLDLVVKGQEEVKEQLLVSMLAGGHALLEGVPGTAKTLLALTLSKLMASRFRRIQFTPDLMPADLIGSNILNQKTHDLEFRPGPIFTDILLADEINRTPPRTQAALLESMQERAVTIDGVRRVVSPIFTVFATQNPIEYEGTYPLPEAQRDRFLMKIRVGYPDGEAERQILDAYAGGERLHDRVVDSLEPVIESEEVLRARTLAGRSVRVEENVRDYIISVVRSTRENPSVEIPAGPRASIGLLEASRGLALLRGRDYVIPDDVKEMARSVLVHRISINPASEMEGVTIDDLIDATLEEIEVPR